MKKKLICFFVFFMLSGLILCDFLTEKITIPNGIYCLDDLSIFLEKSINVPIKQSKDSKYLLLSLDNFKDKEILFLFKILSRNNNIFLRFNEAGFPYFEIESLKKIQNPKELENMDILSADFENVKIEEIFMTIAELMNKKLKFASKKSIKLNLKCKNGVPVNILLDELSNMYKLKISIKDEEIIIE